MLDRGGPVDALDDHLRLVEGTVDVALADLPAVHLVLEVRVPVAPLVDLRGVRVEGLANVEERRLLLELEADRLHRRRRGLLVLGGDERDRLALVAHVVLRQQRLVGRDAERREVAVLEQWDVLPGDHRLDALHRLGLGDVEALDIRVVHG